MDSQRRDLWIVISAAIVLVALAVSWGMRMMQSDAEQHGSGTASQEPSARLEWQPSPARTADDSSAAKSFEPRENAILADLLRHEDAQLTRLREDMVGSQIHARGIADERVLAALRRVPRHLFVPKVSAESAYADGPQRIGHGQTISQPYIVALMTELVRPRPDTKALDIGTGSGYQAAVLGEICRAVYSIEIVESLATDAGQRLASLGYGNVTVRCGDGYRGWPERAPFDAIVVAAAPDHVPQPLVDQLAAGGRLIIPVGDYSQELLVIEKDATGATRRWNVAPVVFVPMTGEAERRDRN
jgi:protein-L-isoaspartate(D-aspartate) O-methyltransferase